MKHLTILELAIVLAVLAFVLWPRQEPATVTPAGAASAVNPIRFTLHDGSDTCQTEPNHAETLAARCNPKSPDLHNRTFRE